MRTLATAKRSLKVREKVPGFLFSYPLPVFVKLALTRDKGAWGWQGVTLGGRSKDTQRAQELPSDFLYPSAKLILFQAQG